MIESFWGVFATGLLLGTPAGITPGPMLVLIIQESLRHGIKFGAKLACIPLITDFPLVLVSGFFFTQVKDISLIMAGISLSGSIFLIYLGVRSIRVSSTEISDIKLKPLSLRDRMMANMLNPNAHLFWFTVGAPLMIKSFEKTWSFGFAFLFSFYFALIGVKLTVAITVGRSRDLLQGIYYRRIMQTLGVMLVLFGLLLFKDGLNFFEWRSIF